MTPSGLYARLCHEFLVYLFYDRPESNYLRIYTGPIFTIFSPNECVLGADDPYGPLFPISQGTLPWQAILWKNNKLLSFVALAFRNAIGYHYVNGRINSVSDASISCKNIVNFDPELTDLICELLYDTAKIGICCQVIISGCTGRIFTIFRCMKAICVQMIDLDPFFRFVKGCCLATN